MAPKPSSVGTPMRGGEVAVGAAAGAALFQRDADLRGHCLRGLEQA